MKVIALLEAHPLAVWVAACIVVDVAVEIYRERNRRAAIVSAVRADLASQPGLQARMQYAMDGEYDVPPFLADRAAALDA